MSTTPGTELHRTAWLAERRKRVQASEVAAVLRMSRWGGPLDVWARKRPDAEEADRDSEPMMWGRVLEPVVMARVAELLGLDVRPNGLRIHAHPEAPLGATPDGLAFGPFDVDGPLAGYEGKTVSWTRRLEWPETGDVPLDVGPGCDVRLPPDPYCQVQACMACTGLDLWYLGALIGGQELRLYRVHRDHEDVAALVEAVTAFWRDHVETGVPPEPHPSDRDAGDALLKAYRLPSAHRVELPAESELHARAFVEARSTRKAAEAAEAYHAACLQRALGPSTDGLVAGYAVRWSAVKGRTALDLDGLRRDRPDLVKEYTKLGAPTRRFDVREVSDGTDSDS